MIAKARVELPVGTYAVVRQKGSRKDVDALLMRTMALEVEAVESRHLRPAAEVSGWSQPGAVVREALWSMDGRLFRQLGFDYRTGDVAPLDPRGPLGRYALGSPFHRDLTDEMPDAVMSAHARRRDGTWSHFDWIPVAEAGLRVLSDPDEAETNQRLVRLQRRLLVVDGALWTECPPPRLCSENRYYGIGVILSAGVRRMLVDTNDVRTMGFQFPLDRVEDAQACQAIADEGLAPAREVPLPAFEIFDRAAITFDAASASAFQMGPNVVAKTAEYLANLSDDGIEAFMELRAASARMTAAADGPLPLRFEPNEDAAIIHEACGRIAADPGVGVDPTGPMPQWLRTTLGQFARRHEELEGGAAPDLVSGRPQP
jgi:hypothetical protein